MSGCRPAASISPNAPSARAKSPTLAHALMRALKAARSALQETGREARGDEVGRGGVRRGEGR